MLGRTKRVPLEDDYSTLGFAESWTPQKRGPCGWGKRARASATRQIRGCAVSMGGRQRPVDLILTA